MNNFLAHYASKYYDPVKVHEYYMRNRELSGRSAKTLTKEGKEVWRMTKANITSEKKQVLKTEQEAHKQKVEVLRNEAKETRERISDKLKQALSIITDRTKNSMDAETAQTKRELEQETQETQAELGKRARTDTN